MKKYLKRKIFADDQIDLLVDLMQTGKYTKGSVSSYSGGKQDKPGGKVKDDIRKCEVSVIETLDYPDISSALINFTHEFDKSVSLKTHFAREMQFISYKPNGKFLKHKDTNNYDIKPRLYTTITMMERSPDLEGGELLWFGPNAKSKPEVIEFKDYETVVFSSTDFHECTMLKKGTRKILIGWIHELDKSQDYFEIKSKKY